MRPLTIFICILFFICGNLSAQDSLHPNIPNKHDITTDHSVGEIPLISEINLTGASTYTVPIDVTPGLNGLQPNLSLSYNSQMEYGIAGVGWSMTGLSSISRVNMTVYHNGRVGPVKLDVTDQLCLDGMRLYELSRNSEYILFESEQGYIRVIGYLNYSKNNYYYFKVLYPNGNIAIMGFNDYYGGKLEYPIAQLYDKNGNYINFTYDFRDEHYSIKKIEYTMSENNTTPFASVEFNYTNRNDILTEYQAGKKIIEDKILNTIICKSNDYSLRTYILTYENGITGSLLSKIECESEGKTLNPLLFEYGQDIQEPGLERKHYDILAANFASQPINKLAVSKAKPSNSSDEESLIVYPRVNPYDLRISKRKTKAAFVTDISPDQDVIIYNNISINENYPYHYSHDKIKAGEGFVQMMAANIDGFPGDEILKIRNLVVNGKDRVLIDIYKYSGYTWVYQKTEYFETGTAGGINYSGVYPKRFVLGDFNGDGKSELLVVSYINSFDSSQKPKLFIVNPNNGAILYSGVPPGSDLRMEHAIAPMDFNGDGKTDICIIYPTMTTVYSFPYPSGELESLAYTYDIKYSNAKDFQFGDFNGDGKTDILVSPAQSSWTEREACYTRCCNASHNGILPGRCDDCRQLLIDQSDIYCQQESYYQNNGNTWTIFYAKGGKDYEGFDSKTISLFNHEEKNDYILQDINLDGLPDLVCLASNQVKIYTNKNGVLTSTPKTSDFELNNNDVILIAGLSSNFHPSIMAFNGGYFDIMKYHHDIEKSQALIAATNSNGVINKIAYTRLYKDQSYVGTYEGEYSEIFPNWKYMGPLLVATEAEVYYDNTLIGRQKYRYANGIVNLNGIGFRGFKNIYIDDYIQGITISKSFDPLRWGVLTEESIPGISRTTYEYNISNNARIIYIKPSKRTETDLLKGNTTTYTYKYGYLNPSEEKIDYGNGNIFTRNTTFTNNISATSNMLDIPTRQTYKQVRGSQNETVRYTDFSYDAKYNLTLKTEYIGGGKASETKYTYDDIGNILTNSTRTFSSSDWLTTTYTYSNNGRYMLTSKSPMNHITQYEYNASLDRLIKVTDYKNNQTSYTYGDFQRIQNVNHPDGSTTTTSYGWDISETHLTYIQEKTTNTPVATTWYDMLGREVKKSTQGFNGENIYVYMLFDGKGRLSKKSEPYTTYPSLWTSNTYDSYNRLTTVVHPSGKAINYEYNGNEVTENDAGKTITKTYNANGDLLKVTDDAGTISYSYQSDGQVKTITTPNNAQVVITYDSYGRRTSLKDPSAGTVSYQYDNVGNLKVTTNAKGQPTTNTYNKFGQLTKRVSPEMTTSYTYHPTDYTLIGISSPTNSYSISYSYDNLGRVTQQKESFAGQTFTKKNIYIGTQLSKIKYDDIWTNPADELQYHYNPTGYLSTISLAKQTENAAQHTIWNLESTNERGQPLRVTLNSGEIERQQGYTSTGFLQNIQVKVNGQIVQNLSYQYNQAKGLLTQRAYNHIDKAEVFKYDALNRLTHIDGSEAVRYDIMGNIIQKNDAGRYSYDEPNNPYAISRLRENDGSVPARIQDVTYSSLGRPLVIAEGSYKAEFEHDNTGERRCMKLYYNNSLQLTRYYLGTSYEKDIKSGGLVTERLYLDGTPYSAKSVWIKENETEKILYIHRDHLGSITALTDEQGLLVAEYSYDAWGRLRNPLTLEPYGPNEQPQLVLARGYTGHEHLPEFGLINMNARLYDPVLGRFLSPDPYVQAPNFSQNFNRYSYAMNNPLVFTDPSGEFFWVVPAVIGAYVGFVAGAKVGIANGAKGWGVVGFAFAGAAIGGLSGYAGAYVGAFLGGVLHGATTLGGAMLNGALIGGAAGFAGGFVSGTGLSLLGNQPFGKSLLNGLKAGGVGAGMGGGLGAITGAIQFKQAIYDFQRGNEDLGVNADDPAEPTDDFLNKSQKAWYPDAPMDKIRNFSVEDIPEKMLRKMVADNAKGVTQALSANGRLSGYSNVYFRDIAFASTKELFFTMGHELVHVSQNAALAGKSLSDLNKIPFFKALKEHYAYDYENFLGKEHVYPVLTHTELRNIATGKLSKYMDLLRHSNYPWAQNINKPF
jgi:RHS repeat-associated protein